MAFVENDACIVEGSPAHVCQRGDFNDIVFDIAFDLFWVHEVVECVEEGAEVGVDLGGDIAGKKAESFACLNRGANQDYFLDLTGA